MMNYNKEQKGQVAPGLREALIHPMETGGEWTDLELEDLGSNLFLPVVGDFENTV